MKIKQRRTFLYISNIVISVICLASMLGYFLMPVFRAEFAVSLTPELAAGAQKIAVMDEGKMVAFGSHKELISQPGIYSQFWKQQMNSAQ